MSALQRPTWQTRSARCALRSASRLSATRCISALPRFLAALQGCSWLIPLNTADVTHMCYNSVYRSSRCTATRTHAATRRSCTTRSGASRQSCTPGSRRPPLGSWAWAPQAPACTRPPARPATCQTSGRLQSLRGLRPGRCSCQSRFAQRVRNVKLWLYSCPAMPPASVHPRVRRPWQVRIHSVRIGAASHAMLLTLGISKPLQCGVGNISSAAGACRLASCLQRSAAQLVLTSAACRSCWRAPVPVVANRSRTVSCAAAGRGHDDDGADRGAAAGGGGPKGVPPPRQGARSAAGGPLLLKPAVKP